MEVINPYIDGSCSLQSKEFSTHYCMKPAFRFFVHSTGKLKTFCPIHIERILHKTQWGGWQEVSQEEFIIALVMLS
jgi:hypothetical protein